ncbi:hypothetical protein NBE98_15885 [Clostridium swellfunianum]|uniref:hypothetical protein n=1 Tax=Clostridium swellfunianum TaxID=1367462 RepID=UPI00202DC853|nr:hypothetical protein [Clostridium swellfunianum]MCM0649847.1 hypothetical protein [Clostridium swellfunianum]
MGKHNRKHNRNKEDNNQGNNNLNNFDMGQVGNLLNMDPSQLSGMLNNIDMNQISSMLQGMGGGGSASKGGESNMTQGNYDKRMELLNAMKPLVDAEKSQLIDSIIQIYNISRIMKK